MANKELLIFNKGREKAMLTRKWKEERINGYVDTYNKLKKVKINWIYTFSTANYNLVYIFCKSLILIFNLL